MTQNKLNHAYCCKFETPQFFSRFYQHTYKKQRGFTRVLDMPRLEKQKEQSWF